MFGFHAISQSPFSDVLRASMTISAEALLASKFGYDSGFSAGFKSETLMPVSLSAKSVMTIAASSSFANGFGLNADGVISGDLVSFDAHLGTALLQSGSIFSSKGVLISVGKANLVGGSNLGISKPNPAEIGLLLYIDQVRSTTNYIDQNFSKTSYIDKELSMEI